MGSCCSLTSDVYGCAGLRFNASDDALVVRLCCLKPAVLQTAVILDPYAQSVVWRRQYGQLGMVCNLLKCR